VSARLTVRGLTRTHRAGAPPSLDRLDLDVPAGACAALLGPSGSGKTTTLRLVAGLDTPDAGDISLDGSSVLGVPPERRGIAMLFQRPLLFPHLSILDNVAFAARVTGVPRRQARADAARFLELVRLDGFGDRRTWELSGGQEQRVALARSLAARPRVLLLDEPFSALDSALRADMHELLRQLRAVLRPTIVMVTHDQHEAAALADTIAVLHDGRLLQHDPPDRLYTRPASLEVSRIMGGRTEIAGVVVAGQHVSALGRLNLPADVVMLDGPAVLLIRHESVLVSDVDDGSADGYGTVVECRAAGARQLLVIEAESQLDTVDTPAPVRLYAEVGPGSPVRPGQRVGVRLPVAARTVVPASGVPVSGGR
jgi:putative spermidine/putrescine transport system ATP-binding protein